MQSIKFGNVTVHWTDKSDGDIFFESTKQDRQKIHPGGWVQLNQIHGTDSLYVSSVSDISSIDNSEADGLVTDVPGLTLGIRTADCVPVVIFNSVLLSSIHQSNLNSKSNLNSNLGVTSNLVGALHCGRKGLMDGALDKFILMLQELSFCASEGNNLSAVIGPCAHSECYEFDDLEIQNIFIDRFGEESIAVSSDGLASLNLVKAISVVLERYQVEIRYIHPECTICSLSYFSFRKTQESKRQITLVHFD